MNITQEQGDNKKTDLVNELSFMYERVQWIWEFHPDNPKKRDVLQETLELQKTIQKLEEEIDKLD
tara:strand:+ start:2294 stop:2488 length:195 start_codon:yes stop_codon:yes gene_type:complete